MKFGLKPLKPTDPFPAVIPDDPEERLAFYDKVFYETYKKKLKLEILKVTIGMSSNVEGDYCLMCLIRKTKRWIENGEI